MDGREKSGGNGTPAPPLANPLGVYQFYTEPPSKILFDQRVLRFAKR